jgi:hypothetical protein
MLRLPFNQSEGSPDRTGCLAPCRIRLAVVRFGSYEMLQHAATVPRERTSDSSQGARCHWVVIILAPVGQAKRPANARGCVFTRLARNFGVELPERDQVRTTCGAGDPALRELST